MLLAVWVFGGFLVLGFAVVIGELAFVALALLWLLVRQPFILLRNAVGTNVPWRVAE